MEQSYASQVPTMQELCLSNSPAMTSHTAEQEANYNILIRKPKIPKSKIPLKVLRDPIKRTNTISAEAYGVRYLATKLIIISRIIVQNICFVYDFHSLAPKT